MITSQEVFAKRKQGQLIEALNMGRELVKENPHDPWNIKALAWTLIDLIKAAFKKNDTILLNEYAKELNHLNLDESDDILMGQVKYVLGLSDPRKKIISDAKVLSKQGNHGEAIKLFKEAMQHFPNDESLHENLAWEYYKYGKHLFHGDNINVSYAKQILADYIQLKNPRPSLLHSLFLKLSDKLIGKEGFRLVAFLKLWDLENLTEDDFQPYEADNGNIYPSIAEKVIQHGAKDALASEDHEFMRYMLPYVDNAIIHFNENIWLLLNKTKLLHVLGRDSEAITFAKSIVKSKINDYWAWDLLGEILMSSDPERGFSCYCKALSCRSEEKFLGNVRLKFAKLLIDRSLYAEAKFEIQNAITSREQEGWKLTQEMLEYMQSEWFQDTEACEDNLQFYKNNVELAESILFDNLPWLNANVADSYTTQNNSKPKRKLIVTFPGESMPKEISVPNNKYRFKELGIGAPIVLKGEVDSKGRFNLYVIKDRNNGKNWDQIPKYIGVIDHVNYEKQLAHFLVDKTIDGILHFKDFPIKFEIGDFVELQISEYHSKKGKGFRAISCKSTKQIPDQIVKNFEGCIREVNGLGFTDDDIFIDRELMMYHNLQDRDCIEGMAVLSYNKKRRSWGWKALKIYEIKEEDKCQN